MQKRGNLMKSRKNKAELSKRYKGVRKNQRVDLKNSPILNIRTKWSKKDSKKKLLNKLRSMN